GRALLAEAQVLAGSALVVGVTANLNRSDLGVCGEHAADGLENDLALGQDVIAAGRELHGFDDLDFIDLDVSERAAVGFGIVRARPGIVRARVLGVENTVAVLVLRRRTTVLLGILAVEPCFVGTSVVRVEDEVTVAVGAAVPRRVAALHAGHVGACVAVVRD